MPYDEHTANRIRRALAGRRGVVEKTMMGGLSFMVGGGMAVRLSRDGFFLIRVTPEVREETLKMPHVKPTEFAGRRMSGFVRIEPEGLRAEAALKAWVTRGVENALALAKGGERTPRAKRPPAKRAATAKRGAGKKPSRKAPR